ncbi:MAG: metallophosphoesterase [Clostridiales bacterium]|nr:metallophosphoesterase [Clostridiales bacterium]
MAIYAIGDLHLPGGQEKPMNVFGSHWDDHVSQIITRWKQTVQPEDLVLIPGDISWAMYFDQAKADLTLIAGLPGEKVLLRGNHDYWWASIGKIRDWLPDTMHALQNDAFRWRDFVICGTRGWVFPTALSPLDEQDTRVFNRELIRLELSLQEAQKHGLPMIVMMHYPPLLKDTADTAFTGTLEKYGVSLCCYGHLHDTGIANAFHGSHHSISYHLVSCDAINFTPKLLKQ